MKRTLLILRHGKSDWEAESGSDHERPLTKRGRKASEFMGGFIAKQGFNPQVVISSTANRALSTAKLVADQLGDSERLSSDQLYQGDPDEFFDILATVSGSIQCVLVVGHNPGLEDLVGELCARDDVILKTCSLAVVNLENATWDGIANAKCELSGLYHPRELMK